MVGEFDFNNLLNGNDSDDLLRAMELTVKKQNEEVWERGMIVVNGLASILFTELIELSEPDAPTSEQIKKIKPILECLVLIKEVGRE